MSLSAFGQLFDIFQSEESTAGHRHQRGQLSDSAQLSNALIRDSESFCCITDRSELIRIHHCGFPFTIDKYQAHHVEYDVHMTAPERDYDSTLATGGFL